MVPPRLIHVLAAPLHPAVLERLEHEPGRLDEASARFPHVDPETLELHPAEPAPDAEDHPPVGELVEHRDLLGGPDGVVPRQHHDHRPEADPPGPRGHPAQELHDVGAHRVVGEVVLDRPHRIEAERLGELREPELVAIDLEVREPVPGVLEERGVACMHENCLLGSKPAPRRARPAGAASLREAGAHEFRNAPHGRIRLVKVFAEPVPDVDHLVPHLERARPCRPLRTARQVCANRRAAPPPSRPGRGGAGGRRGPRAGETRAGCGDRPPRDTRRPTGRCPPGTPAGHDPHGCGTTRPRW